MTLPLTLEALEVLDAIERKGSFAAAAETLNRVPSALTYTVQKLEQDLDVTLFQRQGRRSVLTPAGRLLVDRGREILRASEQLAAATRQQASGWEPRLRIGYDTLVPAEILYPPIREFYELQPGIEIDLYEEVLGGSWEALADDRVDLLIGATDAPPRHSGMRHLAWSELQLLFVAAADHPLCAEPQPLGRETINRYRAVIIRDSSLLLAPRNRGFLNPRAPLRVPDMGQKILAHSRGIGVGFLPAFRIRRELETGVLVALELEEEQPPVKLYIAWKTANRGQALKWFVDKLIQVRLD